MTLFYGHNLNIHIHTITQGKSVFVPKVTLGAEFTRGIGHGHPSKTVLTGFAVRAPDAGSNHDVVFTSVL